jgi:hypothetical protein
MHWNSHCKRVGTTKETIYETRQVCGAYTYYYITLALAYNLYYSDGSGSIDREEFLQIPQIATNPLASRMIAIFDEEYAVILHSLIASK